MSVTDPDGGQVAVGPEGLPLPTGEQAQKEYEAKYQAYLEAEKVHEQQLQVSLAEYKAVEARIGAELYGRVMDPAHLKESLARENDLREQLKIAQQKYLNVVANRPVAPAPPPAPATQGSIGTKVQVAAVGTLVVAGAVVVAIRSRNVQALETALEAASEAAPEVSEIASEEAPVVAEEVAATAEAGAEAESVAAAGEAAAGGGRTVLLDSNVVLQLGKDPTLGGRLLEGEQPVVSYVTGPELRNVVASGRLGGLPRVLADLRVLRLRPALDAIINFRGGLQRATGRMGDGIIGAQATEFGIPLITNDSELKAAVTRAGGIVR